MMSLLVALKQKKQNEKKQSASKISSLNTTTSKKQEVENNSNDTIKKILNIKDVSMAKADDVKNITGYTIGGVSPIGHINKIDIFIVLSGFCINTFQFCNI